jgi:hypothetical protein
VVGAGWRYFDHLGKKKNVLWPGGRVF